MGTFNNKPWSERFQTMGDIAERHFIEEFGTAQVVRLGWNRPHVSMANMSVELRAMPDFYHSDGSLYEVMGCGADGIIKIKLSKSQALNWWAEIQPTYLWVWNSHLNKGAARYWPVIRHHLDTVRVKEFQVDSVEYQPLLWTEFESAE